MSERFYVNCPLAPGPMTLDGAEARHLVVSRVRPGDSIVLFDGIGQECEARVLRLGKRDAEIELSSPRCHSVERPGRLAIACPLPKGDRAQFLIEKLTELGVHELHLLQTTRSIVHPGDAKMEKLHRYVIEASKQCGRNTLMQVHSSQTWKDFCTKEKTVIRLIAEPGSPDRPNAQQEVVVAIGPEGGFTQEELQLAAESGWVKMNLGPRILRMETAALVAATLLGG